MTDDFRTLLENLLDAGHYNDDGDFIVPHEPWHGQGDPPDTSDNPALLAAFNALVRVQKLEPK